MGHMDALMFVQVVGAVLAANLMTFVFVMCYQRMARDREDNWPAIVGIGALMPLLFVAGVVLVTS